MFFSSFPSLFLSFLLSFILLLSFHLPFSPPAPLLISLSLSICTLILFRCQKKSLSYSSDDPFSTRMDWREEKKKGKRKQEVRERMRMNVRRNCSFSHHKNTSFALFFFSGSFFSLSLSFSTLSVLNQELFHPRSLLFLHTILFSQEQFPFQVFILLRGRERKRKNVRRKWRWNSFLSFLFWKESFPSISFASFSPFWELERKREGERERKKKWRGRKWERERDGEGERNVSRFRDEEQRCTTTIKLRLSSLLLVTIYFCSSFLSRLFLSLPLSTSFLLHPSFQKRWGRERREKEERKVVLVTFQKLSWKDSSLPHTLVATLCDEFRNQVSSTADFLIWRLS